MSPRCIAFLAAGSRGDVQPLLALASKLRAKGQQVRFCAQMFYEPIVAAQGLEFFALGGADPRKVWADVAQQRPKTRLGRVWRILNSRGPSLEILARYEEACRSVDAIVCDTSSSMIGQCLGEKFQIPVVLAHLYPAHPTKTYPNPTTPQPRGSSRIVNLTTHVLARQMFWASDRASINEWRRRSLGLGSLPVWQPLRALRSYDLTTIFGFSPAVVPRPADWPLSCAVTGYWFMDESIDPDPPGDLRAFLQSGAPPVSIGFGSGIESTNALTEIALEALRITGLRGVFVQGWGTVDKSLLPDSAHVVESVQYKWLFPQVSLAVHAAGAGTTAEAIRAGIPSVTIPSGGDQNFWARRLSDLGVAPPAIPRAELTANRLAAAITLAATDPSMRERARILGEQVRRENGSDHAASLIMERILASKS
jgi:sterol 3beta-glucosyltransferase